MAYTVQYTRGNDLDTRTFGKAVKKKVEGSFVTLYDGDGNEVRTFIQTSFVQGSPGRSL